MINSQLLANVASIITKNEVKPDTKALKGDLNAKESSVTGTLKKNLGLKQTNQALTNLVNDDLNLKLKNLVNKVLEQLFAKASPNEKLIKQEGRLNFAPNFSNEIKFLVSEMKKSDIFSEILGKLEQILKPANEVKADNFAPLFKNSGVFFEAKLKDALNKESLPKSFHNLLNAIKSLSSPQISSQIIALADKDLDPKASLNELKNIINAQKQENKAVLINTDFKTLLTLGAKLENFKNYISKNPTFAQSHIKELSTNILKQLNKIEMNFKQELKRPENLALKDTHFLKNLNQSFAKLTNTLKAFSNGDFSTVANLAKNPIQSALTPKMNFNESQKAELSTVNEPENSQEIKQTELKESPKTKDKALSNETNTIKETKQEGKIPTIPLQDETIQDENVKAPSPQTQHTKESNSATKENNATYKALTQEQTPQKPSTTPLNSSQEEIQDERSLKNTTENLLKNEKNTPNLKENSANKSELNTTNKALPEKANTQTPTHSNLNESKIMQDRAMPLNEEAKFTSQRVKNLIFSTENAQMPELEYLNKELSTLLRRINESLKQLDGDALNAKTNLADIKNLENKIERASKDLAQIVPKNEAEVSKELKNDIKSTLLQVSNLAKNENNEAVANQANRLLAQIEFNQLMSLANDSINTYLPLFWEDLNESKVIFKRGKKDKYFAQIKLHFAKLGELDILIALKQDKYLDINIMAENKAFRKTIFEHSHELRRSLSKVGLLSSNFFIGDIIRSKLSPKVDERNYDFQMGIDKKA